MLSPEKTPARSAAQFRKDVAENKQAVLAAKGKDGKAVLRSLSKILKRKQGEEAAGSQKSRKVSSTQAASEAGEGRLSTGGKNLKGLGEDPTKKPDTPMALKGGVPPRAASGAAAAESHPQDSPRWLDVQRLSKAMLKTVSKEDREAFPGIQAFNVDRIASLLSEALVRVDSLKKPYARKQEEAETVRRLTAELAESNLSKGNLEAAMANFQAENLKLKEDNDRLLKEASAARANFKATMTAEQYRLIAENEHDCRVRMKIAWEASQPDTPYDLWELAFQYAEVVLAAREDGLPEPEPFDAWAQKQIPEDDSEADGEEEGEEEEQEDNAQVDSSSFPPPEDDAPTQED